MSFLCVDEYFLSGYKAFNCSSYVILASEEQANGKYFDFILCNLVISSLLHLLTLLAYAVKGC